MEVILSQFVHLKDFRKGSTTIRKTFNTDFVPRTGDIIADTVWKRDEEQSVASVEVCLQDNFCLVHITPYVLDTNDKEVLKKHVEMTKLHDWTPTMEIE